MAIPFALTVVALGLAFWRTPAPLTFDSWRREPATLVLAALVLGALGFLNVWDLPTYGFVVAMLVLAANRRGGGDVVVALKDSVGFVLPLAVLAVLAYLPFYDGFASQAGGLSAEIGAGTRPLHAALIWAPLVVVTLPLTLRVALGSGASTRAALLVVSGLIVAVVAVWAVLLLADGFALGEAVGERGANWLTAVFFGGLVLASGVGFWRAVTGEDEELAAAAPALALGFTAALLVFGAEFLYVSDLFSSRLNTVFKLYYQAWILLAVSGGYALVWALRYWRPTPGRLEDGLRGAWAGAAALTVLAALLYPLGATLSRTEGLARSPHDLDGLALAGQFRSDDLAAARWIAAHADSKDRIVEALGGQYSAAGRIAVWTGVPTVLGWFGHEQQWGRDTALLAQRQAEVEAFYSEPALAPAIEFLRRYGITYVVVGSLERSSYPATGLAKFVDLPVAFESGDTTVYRTPVSPAPESVREDVP
jgi:YYY domain-containing protein